MATVYDLLGTSLQSAQTASGEMADQQQVVRDAFSKAQGAKEALDAQNQEVLAKKQREDEMLARLYQLSPDAAGNAVVKLARERQQLIEEQTGLYQEIRAKQQISFFDDPLGWLQARYTIDDTIQQHNAVVDRKEAVTSLITKMPEVIDTSRKANWFGVEATDVQIRKTESDALAAKALQDRYLATKDLASFNLTAEAAIYHADAAAAEAAYKKHQVARSDEMFAMQKKEHEVKLKQLDAAEKDLNFWNKVGEGLSRYYNGASIPGTIAERMYNSQGPEGTLARWATKSILTGSGVGDTAGEAAVASDILKFEFKNAGTNEAAKKLIQSVDKAVERGLGGMTLETWKKLGPEEKASWAQKNVFNAEQKSIKNGSYTVTPDSIYALPNVGAIKAMIGSQENSILFTKAIAGLPDNATLDPKLVLESAKQLMVSGEYGSSIAAVEKAYTDITTLYKNLSRQNYETNALHTLNMPQLRAYRVKIDTPLLSGLPSDVNMDGGAALKKYLLIDYVRTIGRKVNVNAQ